MNMESHSKMPVTTFVAMLFALAFASSLCNASIESVNVDVNFSDGVFVSCNSESNGLTNQGSGNVHVTVPVGQRVICRASWNGSSALFDGYDPQYDQGHAFVYWEVRQDGLYHSWDDKNFVKKGVWKIPAIVEN
ncbi:hypothetical protein MtrunA17_Chr8g0354451 [Medicago truncatula]|uniref:Leguminosin group486 secreted peptide n=2 Tax=Medicago truncatula TaxID=3880 RepID=G7LJ44_MEDTR|nr:leguminosin group486 secreted peptide [Medicago truncatula]RHN40411.1 hypothetical protein MtrunA17_Chr8g0354451 [Medicago truncatula]